MIASCLLALLPLAAPAPPSAVPPAATLSQDPDRKLEYEGKLKAAGEDLDKLWALYLWCDSFGLAREGRSVCRKILKLDEYHREANEALGYINHDGRWFKNQREVDKYKREYEEAQAKARGWVEWEDGWVDPADIPFLERGLVRAADGSWVSAEDLKKMEAGWQRQDLVWIAPEEVHQVEAGLWKCGDQWLDAAAADGYHSKRSTWWAIPSAHFVIYSTCDRRVSLTAITPMEVAFKDLVRIYGVAPEQPLNVALLRSLAQYNDFAANDPLGTSSVYGAYMPVDWIDPKVPRFYGGGAAMWDSGSPETDRWGPLHARFAAGLSFAQAADSSPKALAKFYKSKGTQFDIEAFLEEKQLPPWFTLGGAMFVSRFFIEPGQGGDWARKWSIGSVASRGGLEPLKDIMRLPGWIRTEGDGELMDRRMLESGLLMAFILDGAVPPVRHAHAGLKDALKKGKKVDKALDGLEQVLLEHETDFRAFAGI